MRVRKKSKVYTIENEEENNSKGTGKFNNYSSNEVKEKVRITEDKEAHTGESFNSYYQEQEKDSTGAHQGPHWEAKESLNCSGSCFKHLLLRRVPLIRVLKNYNVREDLLNDVLAGFTMAIMQIAQGLKYAILAGVDPIHGLYTATFPVLIYSVFGTSPHISMGLAPIQCIMMNGVASKHNLDPLDTVTICALWTAIYLLLMGTFRLSSVMVLFSSTLVSGFTFGAASDVLASQLPSLFGFEIEPISGFFIIIRRNILTFSKITETNLAALCMGGIVAIILIINNEFVKPWLLKKTKHLLPTELVIMITGAAVCSALKISEKYDISVVGNIPTGLPQPVIPKFELMGVLATDALVVTIVGFSGTFSLAKLFSSQKGTDLDPQQECYAIALSNLFGSFFSCCNASAGLSRSAVQVMAGAKTTLTALTSSIFLLPILLYLGPYLSSMPKCTLSAIIIVSLKNIFVRAIKEFIKACKTSKADALMWLMPCLATLLLNIEYGLYVGMATAVVVLLNKEQTPLSSMLGKLPGTQMYVDIDQYPNAEEEPGVKLFKMYGALFFSTREYFDAHIKHVINEPATNNEKSSLDYAPIEHVVMDLSSLSSIDIDGGNKLIILGEEFKKQDINMYIVTGTGNINSTLDRLGIKGELKENTLFPTIQDAIMYLKWPDKPNRKETV